MSDVNLDFYKKRPSEVLLEQAQEALSEVNPQLLGELEDVFSEEDA